MILTLSGCSIHSVEFDSTRAIAVISREDGSGTRGAFVELLGIVEHGADGTRVDKTTKEAIIAKQTDMLMMNITNDRYTLGYTSLGALNQTVKAVAVDGIAATPENVQKTLYPITRPFLLATKGTPKKAAQDFIDYILSSDGQAVVAQSYIPVDKAAPAYTGGYLTGKIVVAGSSSVAPLMEKLKEAYLDINPHVTIEIQQNDSSSGMMAASNGTCDIGMASRELKLSENAELTAIPIALDGIAIIVHPDNPVESLSMQQIKRIFTGDILRWSEVLP